MRRLALTLGLLAICANVGATPAPGVAAVSSETAAASHRALFAKALAYGIPLHFQVIAGSGSSFSGGTLSLATKLNNDIALSFGTAGDTTVPAIVFATADTPDTGLLLTGSLSNCWVIAENSDKAFDFAHALSTDPCLIGHSRNQSTTQWWKLTHDGTNAVFSTGAGGIFLTPTQSVLFASSSGSVGFRSDSPFGFASTADPSSALDALFTREGAAIIQHGLDLNGAAIAQTDKACDGITGTDVAGCDYILAAGRGTGIGAPGDIHEQTAKDLATGTTAQTLFERHFYRGKAKALTESSATTFITFNIPTTLTAVGGEVRYCIHATDGTDVQDRCGDADFACVNKAGTVTPSTVNLLGTEATALSSGTLTNTMTLVNSGTTCSMQANAVSSLTQTILEVRYSVEMQGSATVTP